MHLHQKLIVFLSLGLFSEIALTDTPESVALQACGRAVPGQEVVSADVLERIVYFQKIMEQIRAEIGRPVYEGFDIGVENTSQREVYYLTQSMYRKADRLAFEWTHTKIRQPAAVSAVPILPQHIFMVVDASVKRLMHIKQVLGISEQVSDCLVRGSIQSTAIFETVLHTNRELNILLEQPVLPEKIIRQLDILIAYTQQLLSIFPEQRKIHFPIMVRRKSPKDVYLLLANNFLLIEKIFHLSRFPIMTLRANDIKPVSSDIYDLVMILDSELTFLLTHGNSLTPITPTTQKRGKKKFSNVFQYAKFFEAHLEALLAKVESKPDWLEPGNKYD